MKNCSTNLSQSRIKESPDKESRASMPGDFCILEYTNYQLPFIDEEMERQYLKRTPNLMDLINNLKIYPEAIDYLKEQTIHSSIRIQELDQSQRDAEDIIYNKCNKEEEWFWTELITGLIDLERDKHKYIIKRNSVLLAPNKNKQLLNLEKAKAFPITDLIEIRYRMTSCIFHNEKNKSMYYYPETNTCYCFGCHTYADSIKIYQQINNCDFKTAVKALQ